MIKIYPVRFDLKRNARKLFFFSFFFAFVTSVRGQDIHFTQFDFSPVFLNPANTGAFVGDWRLAGTYRSQWKTVADGYRTSSLSFDKQMYLFGRKIGAGLLFLNDESGSLGLTYNKLFATLGIGREINKNFINAGVQIGFASLNYADKYSLPSSYNPSTGGFDQSAVGKSTFYLDVNMGLTWRRNISIFEPEVGLAVSHLNRPNQTLFDGKEKVPIKSVGYFTFKTKISDEIYLTPKFLMMGVSASTLTILGSDVGYNFLGNRSSVKRVFCGFYIRNGLTNELESYSAQAGTTVGRLDIAVSYDMNVSTISQTGKMGAYEITFIYKSISTLLNSYSIPCERY